jgi:hypothetical protein
MTSPNSTSSAWGWYAVTALLTLQLAIGLYLADELAKLREDVTVVRERVSRVEGQL